MSDIEKETILDNDDELESLLRHASPRPIPDDKGVEMVRSAVHEEWRKVTGQNQRRQNSFKFAVAASVLIVAFAAFSVFRPTSIDNVAVASIQKSYGSIYFHSDQSVVTQAEGLSTIHMGQTIETGDDAGLALAWRSGGSLRIDRNTVVEFRDDDSIYLRSGKIYFDSEPSELISDVKPARIASFVVETDRGSASHIGTQFMAEVTREALTVSVREGQVVVDGQYFDDTATRGQQVRFEGRQQPSTLDISEYGELWSWIGKTSPAVDVDGKTIDAFLNWVGRELGYTVRYADDDVTRLARKETMEGIAGTNETGPQAALDFYMPTTGLNWNFNDEGEIYVSNSD